MSSYHYNLSLFLDEVLAIYAERPALYYADSNYKYADLSHWVDHLASLLLNKGLCRGDVIAIGHNKRPLSYALMLAALRLGIVYVNIDVASPQARTLQILEVSRAALLFYDDSAYETEMTNLANGHGCPLLFLDEGKLEPITLEGRELQRKLSRRVDGACVAYVMFTSGSTGVPKGVAVTHQNLLHFIAWGQDRFGITSQDNIANLSPMYFDNSVFDFYVGLFAGAALTPVPRDLMNNPYELVGHVDQHNCTIWFSVPSLLMYLMTMKALAASPLSKLRTIIFGGEGYPKIELKKLYAIFIHRAELVNVYGPTECTCICSAYTLCKDDFDDIEGLPPLGKLNPNFDYRILDDKDHDSNIGELCLIGPNVAAGYFNDEGRTVASFFNLSDPGRYMKRMYRTGDIVKEDSGLLYFVGRKDNQIKHMGYRIELEEIEHALVKLPNINQAAVVYKKVSVTHGKLLGYVACAMAINEQETLLQLSNYLPSYMIPSRIIAMPELPKNPNGKVDRQQLLNNIKYN